MPTPVIVGAARTAIGRSFKGTLVNTPPETLITTVLPEVVRRSGVDPAAIDDIIFAESHYGGGDLARYAAAATGMEQRPRSVGQPALRGQPDRDRQRRRADRLRHGARAGRRRRAVAVDDAADELAHPRPRAEVRGAVDAADARRDTGRACQGHVDHGRLEHRAVGRHHPRGDGRMGGAVASARHRRDGRGQVPRRDHPAEGRAVRRYRSSTSASTSIPVATPPSRSWPGSRCCTPRSRASRSPRATAAAPTTPRRRSRSSTVTTPTPRS